MFRCVLTNRQSEPRESQVKIVIETRPRTYHYQGFDDEGEPIQKSSVGYEIVRELAICKSTFNDLLQLGKLRVAPDSDDKILLDAAIDKLRQNGALR